VWTVKGGPLGGELELCLVLGWCVELMGEDSGARVSEHKRRIRCESRASSAAPSLAALRPVTGGDRMRAASPSLCLACCGS
jgi:hypothetical protein